MPGQSQVSGERFPSTNAPGRNCATYRILLYCHGAQGHSIGPVQKRFGVGRRGGRGHLHPLRHTFCVHMVIAEVPLRRVQVLAGHSDYAIAEKYYARLTPAGDDECTSTVRFFKKNPDYITSQHCQLCRLALYQHRAVFQKLHDRAPQTTLLPHEYQFPRTSSTPFR